MCQNEQEKEAHGRVAGTPQPHRGRVTSDLDPVRREVVTQVQPVSRQERPRGDLYQSGPAGKEGETEDFRERHFSLMKAAITGNSQADALKGGPNEGV